MMNRIAIGSLVVSVMLFFLGFLVLCYCPGWYATAAGFAGLAALLGKSRIRYWGIVWVVMCLAFTVIHWKLEREDKERFREVRQRMLEMQRTKED
jgi:membrane protein implicated in regulation of membrane protease activity